MVWARLPRVWRWLVTPSCIQIHTHTHAHTLLASWRLPWGLPSWVLGKPLYKPGPKADWGAGEGAEKASKGDNLFNLYSPLEAGLQGHVWAGK